MNKNKISHLNDDGDHYRNMAIILTTMGYPMNHSSVRNYVVRIMHKFVDAFSKFTNEPLDVEQRERIAKSQEFQSLVSELLQRIEMHRKLNNSYNV